VKNTLRYILWKLLGIEYYRFLKRQQKVYLDRSANTQLGYKTYHNGAFVWQWYPQSYLKIGSYCSIANDVHFILDDGFHQQSEITSYPHLDQLKKKSIRFQNQTIEDFKTSKIPSIAHHTEIGHDVWIGMNATIVPQVNIGSGATVMAGAVVTTDVPAYSVVGGVPARVVKMKHSPEQIQDLLAIAWWNWPAEQVETNAADFYLPIADFIQKWK
jgi:virginiamycin A acetyltransferase